MKIGQSRDIGNTRHRTKTNKAKNTTQKTKNEQYGPHQKPLVDQYVCEE